MANEDIIDEFRKKIDRPLKAAFSKISSDNKVRDLLLSQQQEKIQSLESKMELLLSILKAQDQRIQEFLNVQGKKRDFSVKNPLTSVKEEEVFEENEPIQDNSVKKIVSNLDFFAKTLLSPAQEWILEQVEELQQKNKGKPVLAKAIQEMFYANRPEIKAKRHAFYHHISKCVKSKRLGKLVVGNQMFLYIPIKIKKEIYIK